MASKSELKRLAIQRNNMKPTVDIEAWVIVGNHLEGIPQNHQNHKEGQRVTNGRWVYTSRIVRQDLENGIIETENTIYKLGNPFQPYCPEKK